MTDILSGGGSSSDSDSCLVMIENILQMSRNDRKHTTAV